MDEFKFGDRVWVFLSDSKEPDAVPQVEDLVEVLVIEIHEWPGDKGPKGVVFARKGMSPLEGIGTIGEEGLNRAFRTRQDALMWAHADAVRRAREMNERVAMWADMVREP